MCVVISIVRPHVRLAMLGSELWSHCGFMLLTRCSTIYGHGWAIQDGPIRYPALDGDKALSWTGCGALCPTGPMSLTGVLGSASSTPSTNSHGTASTSCTSAPHPALVCHS